jgi:hypothetical protein
MTFDDEKRPEPEHDSDHDEPLGPATPDDETPLGDTPEAHDEISPHDLRPDSPARKPAEHEAEERGEDTTRGNR